MFKRKPKQKIKVIAIWNKDKQAWECKIKQKETVRMIDGKMENIKSQSLQTIKECNEFVIPIALLEHNGINTKKLFKNY